MPKILKPIFHRLMAVLAVGGFHCIATAEDQSERIDTITQLSTNSFLVLVERHSDEESVPPRPYQVSISRVRNTQDHSKEISLIAIDHRSRTADLKLIDDSVLIVGVKYSDKTSPYPNIIVPLWKSFSPLELWNGELSSEAAKSARVASADTGTEYVATLRSFTDRADVFSVSYAPLDVDYSPSVFVLGAHAVNIVFVHPFEISLGIRWTESGSVDNFRILLPGEGERIRSVILRDPVP